MTREKRFEVGKEYHYFDETMDEVNGEWDYVPVGTVTIVSRTPVAMIDGYIGFNMMAKVPVL